VGVVIGGRDVACNVSTFDGEQAKSPEISKIAMASHRSPE